MSLGELANNPKRTLTHMTPNGTAGATSSTQYFYMDQCLLLTKRPTTL